MVRPWLPLVVVPLAASALLPAFAGNLYEVQRKEGFYSIARKCGVSARELMGLNPRRDYNKIKVGERLRLPGNANCQTTTVATAEIALNGESAVSSDPASQATAGAVPVNGSASPAGWRHYGPLKVDWKDWQDMDGHWVTKSLNTENQPLYLAVNCPAKRLNQTGGDGQWMAWEAPTKTHQQDLVSDLCREKA